MQQIQLQVLVQQLQAASQINKARESAEQLKKIQQQIEQNRILHEKKLEAVKVNKVDEALKNIKRLPANEVKPNGFTKHQ